MDAKEDESDTDIYMAPLRGRARPCASPPSKKAEKSPRWSPDGKWLAFLSGREGKKTQVWLHEPRGRRGGEADRLQGQRLRAGLVAGLARAWP